MTTRLELKVSQIDEGTIEPYDGATLRPSSKSGVFRVDLPDDSNVYATTRVGDLIHVIDDHRNGGQVTLFINNVFSGFINRRSRFGGVGMPGRQLKDSRNKVVGLIYYLGKNTTPTNNP